MVVLLAVLVVIPWSKENEKSSLRISYIQYWTTLQNFPWKCLHSAMIIFFSVKLWLNWKKNSSKHIIVTFSSFLNLNITSFKIQNGFDQSRPRERCEDRIDPKAIARRRRENRDHRGVQNRVRNNQTIPFSNGWLQRRC